MAWQCIRCGFEVREYLAPSLCRCGLTDSFALSGAGAAAAPRARPRPIRLDELPTELPRIRTGERAVDRLTHGGFPCGTSITVYGGEGAGKSTLVLRWSSRMGHTAVVCPEMGHAMLRATAARAGARLERLHLCSEDDWREAAAAVRARVVLFDSVSRAARPVAALRDLIAWAAQSGGVAFALAHMNAKGRPLGPRALGHDPDAVLRVHPGGTSGRPRVEVRKARFCPRGECEVRLIAARTPREPQRKR